MTKKFERLCECGKLTEQHYRYITTAKGKFDIWTETKHDRKGYEYQPVPCSLNCINMAKVPIEYPPLFDS
tara:strand:- start:105 stop:314 length:210 start_codon:yes stop_codon:yes gene_type:complete